MNPSEFPVHGKDYRLALLTGTAVGLAALAGVRSVLQHHMSFPEILSYARWIPLRCPMKALTALDCPLCGLGRSLLALAWGDLPLAWASHPLGPLLALLAGYAALLYLISPRLFRSKLETMSRFWRQLNSNWKFLTLVIYFLIFVARQWT